MFLFFLVDSVRGDLYKPNRKLFHIDGSFNLGTTSYNGKAHLESDNDHTRIELRRLIKLGKSSSQSGYDFVYERKNDRGSTQNNYNIVSHLSLRRPDHEESVKVFNLRTDFTRAHDLSNATLESALDFVILTRNPPIPERIEVDYMRQSVRTNNQGKRLISPKANLKIQIKTKSNVFNFLLNHRHRRSSRASKKGLILFEYCFSFLLI